MFTREITGLKIMSGVAANIFPRIYCEYNYGLDETFMATMRAILHKRIPDGERVRFEYNYSNYENYQLSEAAADSCVRAFLTDSSIRNNNDYTGIINIHSFNNSGGVDRAFQRLTEDGLEAVGGGFEELTDIAEWMEQHGKCKAKVYINPARKSVAIFVGMLDLKRWHLLQSLLPRYFPWYINEDNPLEEIEIELLRSLTKRYAPDYEKLIDEFTNNFDFRTEAIRTQLKGFETYFEKKKLRDIERDIRNVEGCIQTLERQFAEYYRNLRDYNITKCGLVEKINSTKIDEGKDSELTEYFLCNKSLSISYVSDGEIEFIVSTTVNNYDPDMFERIINNKNGFFFNHYETHKRYGEEEMTDDRIKRLMIAIFRDEKLKLRTCAAYRLNFSSGTYEGLRGYSYPEYILKDHTPNQHIHHYACLGNNSAYIRQAMNKHDYVGAISACCSSAQNMNMSEANTGTFFMEQVLGKNPGKVIQMPDGSTMTPLEAVMWLEAQDKSTEEQVTTVEKEKEADDE